MYDITEILAQLALIIVVARLAGYGAGKIGVPPVVGEIAAGVLLGPSLLGGFSTDLFPVDSRPFLSLLASVGLVLFMFVVGLELDVKLVKGRGRVAASVSVTSILLPFSLGIGLAALLSDDLRGADGEFLPFALFVGAAMSITAFPVLARILTDRRMHRTQTGGLALACAATDDVLAWTLLAVVIGIAGGEESSGHGWVVFLAIPFVLLALFVVRPALTFLTRMHAKAGELTPTILSIVLVGLLLFAAATEYLGVHYIFGAFLFGAIIPHEQAAVMRHEILVRLEQLSVVLLLPVFFLTSGLKVDIRGLGVEHIAPLLGILAVAIIGKYVGAYLGARSAGVPHWQANALGILMNTRGLTELIILNVGLELGLIGKEMFTMMVIMALVTTVMTGPLLRLAYPDRRVARDIAEAERVALGLEARDRALVVALPGRDSTPLVDLAVGMLSGQQRPEIVVAALEPQVTRRLDLGSGLSGELAEMAAAMERQEAIVKRGEAMGVPVRIIANPSGDIGSDLRELSVAIAPQYALAWADDAVGRPVAEAVGCPVALAGQQLGPIATGTPVRVAWTGDDNGDAAVVLGARVARALGSTLEVTGEGRRYEPMMSGLADRGVALAPAGDGVLAVTLSAVGRPGDVQVRSELDPTPVDWPTADLGDVPAADPA